MFYQTLAIQMTHTVASCCTTCGLCFRHALERAHETTVARAVFPWDRRQVSLVIVVVIVEIALLGRNGQQTNIMFIICTDIYRQILHIHIDIFIHLCFMYRAPEERAFH